MFYRHNSSLSQIVWNGNYASKALSKVLHKARFPVSYLWYSRKFRSRTDTYMYTNSSCISICHSKRLDANSTIGHNWYNLAASLLATLLAAKFYLILQKHLQRPRRCLFSQRIRPPLSKKLTRSKAPQPWLKPYKEVWKTRKISSNVKSTGNIHKRSAEVEYWS